MLFLATTICGVSSLVFLKKRTPKWDDLALATAEIAVVFGAAVLITGSIWAKAAWDIWWSWEKRLTMSLLLWLALVGYVLVRRFAGASADRLAAGPRRVRHARHPVHLHDGRQERPPPAGRLGRQRDDAHGPMKLVFWMSVLTFFLWFLTLVMMRVQSAAGERELRELREKGLDAGVLS